jgi:hypothetical protein
MYDDTPLRKRKIHSRLSNKQVAQVKRLLNEGYVQSSIAEAFGVSTALIRAIRSGKLHAEVKAAKTPPEGKR